MVFYVTDKLGQRRLSLRSLSSYPPGETYAALATARVSRDNTSYNTTYLNFPIASDTSVREVNGEVAVDVVLCPVIVLKRHVSTGYGIYTGIYSTYT